MYELIGGNMENYLMDPKDYLIMIVDDENIIRMISEEMLRELGYQVIGFEKPVEAVEYYHDHFSEIDFVILDMMMPELNGAEVFYKLMTINPFTQAIVLSGYEGVETKYKQLLDDGLCGFLMKPMNPEVLDKRIKEIINADFTIDCQAGMATLMNKEHIYIKLLQTYYEENKNLDIKILKLIQNNDFDGVGNLIHKIKGISLNLCSRKTYELSKKLNRKFVDNDFDLDDIVYFIKHHYFLIKDIERLLGRINVQEC